MSPIRSPETISTAASWRLWNSCLKFGALYLQSLWNQTKTRRFSGGSFVSQAALSARMHPTMNLWLGSWNQPRFLCSTTYESPMYRTKMLRTFSVPLGSLCDSTFSEELHSNLRFFILWQHFKHEKKRKGFYFHLLHKQTCNCILRLPSLRSLYP